MNQADPVIIVAFVLLGLCFGSFVNALVWRLRHHRDMVRERSECTHCHHVLAWNDLLPVVSWLWLRGRCRYCHRKIEDNPIIEAGTAVLFLVSYLWWPWPEMPIGAVLLGIWLVCGVVLMALIAYDARWYLLPDVLVWPLVGAGIVWSVIRYVAYDGLTLPAALWNIVAGVVAIAGLYWLLHTVSKGNWVGFGDVKLCIFIGAILGWQLALTAVFVANTLGLVWILPQLFAKKLSPKSRIPFGPFLIIACMIMLIWGERIIGWYMRLLTMG